MVVEDEPEIADDVFCLDWLNSDLNLKIDKETFMGGEPFNRDGWGYVWAGARATHGFTGGKVCFEVKLLDNMETKIENDKNVHELRLGWSTDDSPMPMGETAFSFAYSGSAKKANAGTFEDYGVAFAKGDTVAAYLDMEGADAVFTFARNGESQGEAFSVPKSTLEGKALFPHVSTRNVKFEVNFGKDKAGEAKEAFAALIDGYEFVANVDEESRVRGMKR